MAAPRQCQLKSPLGDKLLFAHMRVSEALSQLFEIELEAVSVKLDDVDPTKLLGKTMTITVEYDDGSKRFFNGYVTRMSYGAARGRYFVWHFTLRPWLWFLTRTSDCRIFQELNVPDILKEVFADEETQSVKPKLSDQSKYLPWEYCVQYRETDYNFVARLMEQEGIYYFFEHSDGAHTLVLLDSKSAQVPVTGGDTLPFVPTGKRQSQPREHIDHWDANLSVESGSVSIDDYDFKRPSAVLDVVRKPETPSGFLKADYEVYDYPGDFDSSDEGDSYASARIEELHGRSLQYHGSGSLRFFTPGARFKLVEHPAADQNTEYLIVSTRYEFADPPPESGARVDSEFACSFNAIRSAQQFRPLRTTPRPLIQGIQTAEVCGPAGEEIYTDKYGRIKVQFHWDRRGKKDEKTSCWMRVAFPVAGARFGFVAIPRIGHEVVVSFLEGDPDRPLATGVVYNGANTPPWDLPANMTQMGLLSRSTKGGSYGTANAIRFEDKKGSEQLWLHAEKNQDIEVENDETHWVGHDRKKTIDHDETTHVKHDRTETVDNNEKITIGVNRTENVGSMENITIGVNRTESVGANETISIGANRTITVGASETATVALQRTHTVGVNETITVGAAQEVTVGAMRTLTVGANQTTNIGAAHSVSVGASESVTVGAGQTVNVGADREITVGSNLSTTVGADESSSVAGGRNTSVGKDDALKVAKNLVIDAGDSIVIKTGDASISMKKDGTISIKGKDISIDASGKINVKASSDITMKGSKILQN